MKTNTAAESSPPNSRAPETDVAVDVAHVSKRFGSFEALRDVSVAVKAGETVALLGPSGCGKTTLLRAVCGLVSIDEGEIRLGSTLASSAGTTIPVERRNVGMMFQSYVLWPHMTVGANVAYCMTYE